MEVKAVAKYIKMSPKKIRLVTDLIKKLPLREALDYLSLSSHRAARPLLKVINSAIANAEHNFGFKKENLYIKNLLINQGPSLKRWTAKARGMAAPIKRRSAHIVVVLESRGAKIPIKKEKIKMKLEEKQPTPFLSKEMVQPATTQEISEREIKKITPEAKPEIFDQRRAASGRGKQHLDKVRMKRKGGFLKRIFRRKAI